MKRRNFLVEDIDCSITVEIDTRKNILSAMDEFVENLEYDWFDASDEVFEILYKDGTEDRIDEDYDGHKIKRQNIESMVYSNPCTYVVYGNFEMNDYGVVHTAYVESISDVNIKEIA